MNSSFSRHVAVGEPGPCAAALPSGSTTDADVALTAPRTSGGRIRIGDERPNLELDSPPLRPDSIALPRSDAQPGSGRGGERATAQFATTRWTEVLAAPGDEGALAKVCRKYWYPLYAFLRRSGVGSHDAEDLIQGFFSQLLRQEGLATVRRENGRFRSFLIAALRNFVADQRDRARAAKRAPALPLIEFDAREAEDRYRLEPIEHMTPETILDRRWALTLLDEAMAALEAEFNRRGKADAFRVLKPFLHGESGLPSYRDSAARLAVSAGAARVLVHRMRDRYRELVRRELADTLAAGEDLEAEMRHLFSVLRHA